MASAQSPYEVDTSTTSIFTVKEMAQEVKRLAQAPRSSLAPVFQPFEETQNPGAQPGAVTGPGTIRD